MRISDWSSDVCSSDLEGGALDPHIFAAVHRFLDPGAERLAGAAVRIRGKGDLEIIFVDDLAMLLGIVLRDADDPGSGFFELAGERGEGLGLGGYRKSDV